MFIGYLSGSSWYCCEPYGGLLHAGPEAESENKKKKFMVNVLKFQTLVVCQKGLDKQRRQEQSDLGLRFLLF